MREEIMEILIKECDWIQEEKTEKSADQILSLIKSKLMEAMPKEKVQTLVNCQEHNLEDDYSTCIKCHWEITPEQAGYYNQALKDVLEVLR